jgi:hypothetical protein
MRIIILILSTATFIRFLFADNSISFDYQFYIKFFNEINDLSTLDLVGRIREGFPYVFWGTFKTGKFELGFAVLAYVFGKLLNPELLYSFIAAISIYLKLDILRKFKVHYYFLFIFYIFDIVVFESNQMRAGLALAVFMALMYNNIYKNNPILTIFLAMISMLIHVSIVIPLIILYLAYISLKLNNKYIFMALIFLVEIICVMNLESISSLFGGKVAEYNMLSNNFDVYNKTSGINIASIMALTFGIYFIMNIRIAYNYKIPIYGVMFSISSSILILFSDFFIILSDRIWLLLFPILILLFSNLDNFWKSDRNNLLFKILIIFESFLYTIINLLYRYPSSNFFDFIIPVYEFIPPTLI